MRKQEIKTQGARESEREREREESRERHRHPGGGWRPLAYILCVDRQILSSTYMNPDNRQQPSGGGGGRGRGPSPGEYGCGNAVISQHNQHVTWSRVAGKLRQLQLSAVCLTPEGSMGGCGRSSLPLTVRFEHRKGHGQKRKNNIVQIVRTITLMYWN